MWSSVAGRRERRSATGKVEEPIQDVSPGWSMLWVSWCHHDILRSLLKVSQNSLLRNKRESHTSIGFYLPLVKGNPTDSYFPIFLYWSCMRARQAPLRSHSAVLENAQVRLKASWNRSAQHWLEGEVWPKGFWGGTQRVLDTLIFTMIRECCKDWVEFHT